MAKELKTNIKVGMNSTEVTGSVSEINRQLRVLDSEFQKTAAQARAVGDASGELAAKQTQLTQKIELQSAKVTKLRADYEKARTEKGENAKATANLAIKYNQAEASLAKMQATLKEATDKIDKSSESVNKLSKEFSEFKNKADEIGLKLDKVGQACTAVGIAFTALGVGAGKSFLDFENAFKMTTTLIDENVLSLNSARKGILKISDDTGKAAGDLSKAMYDALSSNIKTADSLGFLADSAALARAGFTETSTSVDILTTILNSYGYTVKDVKNISDQLILTQNAGKITVGQLGDNFGQVAGIAAQAKVPLKELLAGIATLTSNGVNASESITELRSIISAVLKPTSEAAELAKKLHIQFNLTALQSKGLAGFLADVQQKTHGNAESFATLFGRVEALNASLILTGKGAKNFNEVLGQMDKSAGLTAAAIGKLDENKAEQFQKSLNKLKNSFVELGAALSPFITMLTWLFTLLSKLPTPVLMFLAVLGPVLIIVGQIISLVVNFQMVLGIAGKAGQVASLGMTAFGKKLLIVLAIVVAVAAAITILVLAINALTGKSGAFVSQMNAVSNSQIATPQINTPSIPGFATGINLVPNDMLAVIHKDEAVVPARYNPYNPDATHTGSGDIYNLNVQMSKVDEVYKLVNVTKKAKQKRRAGRVVMA